MKPLNEYPTPVTDEIRSSIPEPSVIQKMIPSHSDLERKLAACRETLGECDTVLEDNNYGETGHIRTLIRETLKATKP